MAVGNEQGEEAVQIVLPVVWDLILIPSLLGIQPLRQLALLMSCVELVLQGSDLPQIVDTQHPLGQLSADPRECGVSWMDFRWKPHAIPDPEVGI